ncbi:MAG: response regulator transcription factor [Rhodoferax sp.]|uniref:response regulator n=1 Tax=Rhodoferax sp. TaxID=50421 RepID=UPI002613C7A0|nr:response regulator transcription factor [Rhodoferax sp.]MDD5334259.1 response regulator transcription factor [Rhodoferax sp.]
MRLLIVEDDALLGAGLRAALSKWGFTVTWVRHGAAALDVLANEEFVAMVLDIGLPDVNGLEVLRKLRAGGNKLPVMILTARDTTRDKVASLDLGADDYLVKTTDMEELVARLRALVRRSGRGGGVISVGDLVLNLDSRVLTLKGEAVNVSRREFDVLRVLMEGAGRVLTRAQLEQSLYGWNRNVDSNAVEVHIHNLRLKIGATTLKTVRGVGYTIARNEA